MNIFFIYYMKNLRNQEKFETKYSNKILENVTFSKLFLP